MRHAVATLASKRLRARAGGAGVRRQRGVYAIEFAFVFLLFFALIYAIICYGLLFTFRAGLQNAAEDGARAALRYQTSLPAREAKARSVALQQTSNWLPVTLGNDAIEARICELETQNCGASRSCGAEWSQRCQIVVTIRASGMNRILPMLKFAMPDTLVGQASMLMDGSTL